MDILQSGTGETFMEEKKENKKSLEIKMFERGSIGDKAGLIAKNSENGTLEAKLLFPDSEQADTFCRTGRLPGLEQPPVTVLVMRLESEHKQNYLCRYNKGDSHAILQPTPYSATALVTAGYYTSPLDNAPWMQIGM